MDRELNRLRQQWMATGDQTLVIKYITQLRRRGMGQDGILNEIGADPLYRIIDDFGFDRARDLLGNTLVRRLQIMRVGSETAVIIDEVESLIENRYVMLNRFTFIMPAAAVQDLSGQGDVSEAAEYWQGRIDLSHISDEDLIAELSEYGAWSAEDLQDRDLSEQRLLFVTAGQLSEQDNEPFGGPLVAAIVDALQPLIERGEIDVYRGYAYGSPESLGSQDTVFAANWNAESVYDAETRSRVSVDDSMSRLGDLLEGLTGVETDWNDEIVASCSSCQRAIPDPTSAGWDTYDTISGDYLCNWCLVNVFPDDYLDELTGEEHRYLMTNLRDINPEEYDYSRVSSAEHVSRHIFSIPSSIFDNSEVNEPDILRAGSSSSSLYDPVAYMRDDDLESWIDQSMDVYDEQEEVDDLTDEERGLIEAHKPVKFLNYLLDNRREIKHWPESILSLAKKLERRS